MEAELSWKENGKSTRVKGIPNASTLPSRLAISVIHQGFIITFIEQGTLKVTSPPRAKGAKVLDTTTRADYIVTNRVSDKRKISLCVCGNQQQEGITRNYNSGNLYASVMKAAEVWLMMAIAAKKENLNVYNTNAKQAFLNGDIGEEIIFI